jgi:S-DNA-T family DNA segregation ATPase FtsK/SpoIIIE
MLSTVILRLTVQDVHSRASEDVEVIASPDSPIGALLDSMPVNPGRRQCFIGAAALDRRARLADSPLLVGAVLSVGGAGPDYQPVRGAAIGTLHVIEGPDAGFGVALLPGTHTIGRAADSGISLSDANASRLHARVDIYPDGTAVIADAGSANGTLVDGTLITGPTALRPGSVTRIGDNSLRWAPGGPAALRVAPTADGRLEFDRVFTATPAIPQGDVDLPPKGPDRRNPIMVFLSAIMGIVPGLALYAGTQDRSMLLFSVLGMATFPIMTIAVESGQRRGQKRAAKKARESATAQVTALAADEDRARRLLAPGPAEIAAMVAGTRQDLWPRDARSVHGLRLRVGVADLPASVRLRGEPWDGFELPVLRGVPVTLDLREIGVLGLTGTGEPARALLRWLLVQLATLRSPDDLRLVLLTSGGTDLDWARWLPHLDPGEAAPVPSWYGNTDASRSARIEELRRLITARLGEEHGGIPARPRAEVIVVLDGALALRNLPGIRDILRLGPEAGVYTVCMDSQSMSECRGLCALGPDGIRLINIPNGPDVPVAPDLMDAPLAEQLSRALAPMRDRISGADVETAIPYPVRLLDLMGLGTPTPDDILQLWRGKEEGPKTGVVLGADAAGPAIVDIARQGPHTMLGGATGAGKSILLQTLVTALLLANRPDELNLVLVDFKGGSAFLPFERCPHVIALIRSTGETAADSFDEADAARVLASVRAEVRRRESILARYGGEIDHYWRSRGSRPDLPPLPRLVMIFDEFARVLDTSPNFLKELVNVSAKGRSLGVHLVLATQSLQGKLSPELKNNIDLRISLRQNEPADSTEVLGAPDAATIPGTLRGRGMILVTKDESRTPRLFQSGYLGDPPPDGGAGQVSVRTLTWADLGSPRPDRAVGNGDGQATDQTLVIKAIEEAADQLGLAAPFRALLPALPVMLPLDGLAGQQTVPSPDSAAPFGLADVPEQQAQPAYCLDVAGTDRLMVAGGPQSGRTTFARALITSLASRFRPDQVHLYVVEHQPGGLADYGALPHCGGVFSPAEPDRVRRLVTWLGAETKRRTGRRFDPGGQAGPVIVVIIDGWEQFESRADPSLAEVSLGPTLREIIAAGAPLGIHIVPIGGQDLLTGKVPALCSQRLLLPFPNADTRRAHLRSGMTPPPMLPGRAIDAATGLHVQVCIPSETGADLAARVSHGPDPASLDAADLDAARLPKRFPSLPSRVSVAELPLPEPLPSPSWIPLGVGGQDVAAGGIDFFGAGPHQMLISGPPGSGRTTAVATLARLLNRNGIGVLAVAPPRSPLGRMLADDDGITVISRAAVEDTALREAVSRFGDRRYAVLLDDADTITVQAAKQGFGEAPTLLDEIAHPSQLGQRALVLACDATPILSGNRRAFAKIANEILQSGTRLLLTPAKRADARQLNMTLEPGQYFTRPPGRGYLASTGAPTLIQLAI